MPTMKSTNAGTVKKVRITAVTVAAVLIFGVFLTLLQLKMARDLQEVNTRERIEQTEEQLKNARETASQNRETYDKVYKAKAKTAAYRVIHDVDYRQTAEWFKALADSMNVTNILLLDAQGNVLVSAAESDVDFTSETFAPVLNACLDDSDYQAFTVKQTGASMRYYAASVEGTREVVVENNSRELDDLQEKTTSYESVLSKISVGLTGYTIAVSDTDGTFLYHPEAELIGTDAAAQGLERTTLQDGKIGWISIGGKRFFAGINDIPEQDITILCVVPESEFLRSNRLMIGAMAAAFLLIFIAVTVYVYYCIRETMASAAKKHDTRRLIEHSMLRRKIFTSAVIGTVFFFAAAFYCQTLLAISLRFSSSRTTAAEVVRSAKDNQAEVTELTNEYNRRYLNKAQAAADILTRNPALKTRKDLAELSKAIDVEYIILFDGQGQETVSDSSYVNFKISDDPDSQSYEFNKLLLGVPYVIQKAQPDDTSGKFQQFIGVLMKNSAGETDGFLQIAVVPTDLEKALSATELSNVLGKVRIGSGGFIFSVDKESKNISYYPGNRKDGKSASDIGITDQEMKNGYNDFLTIDGKNYLAYCAEGVSNYIYVAVPEDRLMANRMPVTCISSALCLLLIAMMELLLLYVPELQYRKAVKADDFSALDVTVTSADGTEKKTKAAAERWSGKYVPWAEQNAGEKMRTVVGIVLGIFAAVIVVLYLMKDRFLSRDSIMNYIASGRWQKGWNIFAVTACFMLICVCIVALKIYEHLIKLLSKIVSPRGETICRLVRSFGKYLMVVFLLYYCLSYLGTDATTLWTSAGILSVVIGLGARSIISDILSGLFIIFEGDFQVGDIVQVGDWRGIVEEIGVRTTKIIDGGHNVKIICNSELVSGVVNMTRQSSVCTCDIGIDYGESLERVETILQKELPLIKKHLPAIVDGPYYKGVLSLGDSAVNIRIIAQCNEGDRIQLGRDLNREMKILFDKYDVNIPFPQVVVNQPKEYQKATANEKRAAEAFNVKQKELSKNISTDAIKSSNGDSDGDNSKDSGDAGDGR